jgi:hypothetical protein
LPVDRPSISRGAFYCTANLSPFSFRDKLRGVPSFTPPRDRGGWLKIDTPLATMALACGLYLTQP